MCVRLCVCASVRLSAHAHARVCVLWLCAYMSVCVCVFTYTIACVRACVIVCVDMFVRGPLRLSARVSSILCVNQVLVDLRDERLLELQNPGKSAHSYCISSVLVLYASHYYSRLYS